MSRAFLESVIHRPHRILGYRLRPYSLAVAAALEAAGDPLTTYPVKPADVICYLKIASAKNPLNVRIKATWLDKLRAIRLLNPKHMVKAVEEIREYEGDFGSMPTLATAEAGFDGDIPALEKGLSAPWIAARIASLHLNTNLTDWEAWNLPIGYVMWLDAAAAESRGGKVTFIDPENPELTDEDLEELRALAKEPIAEEDPNVADISIWKNEKLIIPEKKQKRPGKKTRR